MWAAPPGLTLQASTPGHGQVQGALEGHIRGHFLLFLLIHGLVPSLATEEFPVPCLSSRAWGQDEKMTVLTSGLMAGAPQNPKVMGFSAGPGRGVIWLLPGSQAERKGSCFGRPSRWAGWPGLPSHLVTAPDVTAPSPSWPSLGKGEPAERMGSRSKDADLREFREELRGASWHAAVALPVNASSWDHARVTLPQPRVAWSAEEAQWKC